MQLVRNVPGMKKGIHGSRRGSSSPADPPSDGPRRPGGSSIPSRPRARAVTATASRSSAAAAIVNHPPPSVGAFETPRVRTRSGGRRLVHRGHELHVLVAERHDPVRGPPARAARPRSSQPELLAEPDRGLVQIGDGVHDVVEPQHAATLAEGPTYTRVRDPQAAAARRPRRRARPVDRPRAGGAAGDRRRHAPRPRARWPRARCTGEAGQIESVSPRRPCGRRKSRRAGSWTIGGILIARRADRRAPADAEPACCVARPSGASCTRRATDRPSGSDLRHRH